MAKLLWIMLVLVLVLLAVTIGAVVLLNETPIMILA